MIFLSASSLSSGSSVVVDSLVGLKVVDWCTMGFPVVGTWIFSVVVADVVVGTVVVVMVVVVEVVVVEVVVVDVTSVSGLVVVSTCSTKAVVVSATGGRTVGEKTVVVSGLAKSSAGW